MNEIEVLKKKLERACEVHRVVSKPKPPKSDISTLGLLLPSHLWSSDADDMIAVNQKDIDDMWIVFDKWFKGLERRESLVVLFRSGGMGFKTLQYILDKEFKIYSTSRATLSTDYQKGLLKILCNAKDNGFNLVFADA